MNRPFSVMVKPVGSRCNLGCSFCYYLAVPRLGPIRMTDQTLEALISQYIAASPGKQVSFVWHGGEPTLADLDFYTRVVELQARYLPKGWQCWNSLQTNGLLLDDQWCRWLAEHHFDVGLSIDGTATIHDLYRRTASGSGSYQGAVTAIKRLQDHGLQPDLLCTVTSTAAKSPLAVYQALRDFNTGWIQFIPIVRRHESGQLTADSISAEAYGHFLCTVFDEWVSQDLGRLDVQLFAETMRTLAGGQAGLCWLAPTCGRALVVEADGAVYACDHYVNADHHLGDLSLDDLAKLANSEEQQSFGQAKADLVEKCLACPWLRLCQGGCPKDRVNGLNLLCDGLTDFFAHATPVLRQVIDWTRTGRSPELIRQAPALQLDGC